MARRKCDMAALPDYVYSSSGDTDCMPSTSSSSGGDTGDGCSMDYSDWYKATLNRIRKERKNIDTLKAKARLWDNRRR